MSMYDVCGIGNAIVDILVEVSDGEFKVFHFERGSMRLVDVATQRRLLAVLKEEGPHMASGGSVANSVIALSQLGGGGAFIGLLGDDRYGLHYKEEFDDFGIDMGNPLIVGEHTGTSVVIITPDAERTMRTCLGVNSTLSEKHIDEERIKQSRWLFVEGYLFANGPATHRALFKAIRCARSNGVKVAVTCSDAFIVQTFGVALREALAQADFVFANETEAMALAGGKDAGEAFARLKDLAPGAAVSAGPRGAYVRYAGEEFHAPAFPCEPKDLTGAGDMFAGAFLYGITHEVAPCDAARRACYLCMKVITQIGARLTHGAKEFWKECPGQARTRAAGVG